TECSHSDLWYRESAGGNDQGRRAKLRVVSADDKLRGALHFANAAFQEYLHSSSAAFGFEHAQDVVRRMVAEELSPRFLVVGNMMFFDQGDEIRRRIPGQRG